MKGLAGFFLDALDLRPLDLADPAALDADQMVVVRTLVFNLKFGMPGGRGDPLRESALFEHLQGPKYRHLSDPLMLERLIDIIHRDMTVGVKEEIDDHLALVRMAQPLIRQVLLKDFMDARDVTLPPRGPGRKKDQFFGGNRGHRLLKLPFNNNELGRGGQETPGAGANYTYLHTMR